MLGIRWGNVRREWFLCSYGTESWPVTPGQDGARNGKSRTPVSDRWPKNISYEAAGSSRSLFRRYLGSIHRQPGFRLKVLSSLCFLSAVVIKQGFIFGLELYAGTLVGVILLVYLISVLKGRRG